MILARGAILSRVPIFSYLLRDFVCPEGATATPVGWQKVYRKMKKIGIITKRSNPETIALVKSLADWLRPKNIEIYIEKELEGAIRPSVSGSRLNSVDREEIPDSVEMIIVLGGDGTLLSVAVCPLCRRPRRE